jgi:hypothetical protein
MVAEPRLGACDAAVVHAVHGLKAYARHAAIVWVVGHRGRRECKATASRGRRGGTCGLVCGGGGSAVLADTRGFLGGRSPADARRGPWPMPSDQCRAAIGLKGIRLLHTQLSQGERHETRRIGPYAMPWDQHIKGGHGAREPGVEKRPAPVHDFLDVPDQRPH